MKEITITEIAKKHTVLREALEQEEMVRIVWKEQKPNGKILFAATAKKEDIQNV